jgi:hypothetical protein
MEFIGKLGKNKKIRKLRATDAIGEHIFCFDNYFSGKIWLCYLFQIHHQIPAAPLACWAGTVWL